MGTEQVGLTVPSHVLLESGPTSKARKAAVVVVVGGGGTGGQGLPGLCVGAGLQAWFIAL